jgi:hypothetical protein
MEIDFKEPPIVFACLITSLFFFVLILSMRIFSPSVTWWLTAGLSAAWFLLEHNLHREVSPSRVMWAAHMGIFLMLLCFLFYAGGSLLGLLRTSGSSFQVLSVPVELLFLSLFFGAAHYIYLPRAFDPVFSAMDVTFFAFFGAAWESLLIRNGMLAYYAWWTPTHALLAFGCAWVILHFVKYRFLTPK